MFETTFNDTEEDLTQNIISVELPTRFVLHFFKHQTIIICSILKTLEITLLKSLQDVFIGLH